MSTPTATHADSAPTPVPRGNGSRRAPWWLLLIVPILAVGAVAITKATQDDGSTASTAPVHGHAVTIKNFAFSPAPLAVKAGTAITVTNADDTTHTVTADKGNAFDTGHVEGGSTATIAALAPGKYAYHCAIHNYMTGVIEVTK